jgi:guanylate kinase
VISGPSGSGKSTLCDRLRADRPGIRYSVSCTTRAPRGDEQDGRDYFFLTDEAFAEQVRNGAFLEHAVVHGHSYGTLRNTVEQALDGGRSVLLDIDVQGAAQLRASVRRADGRLQRDLLDIFIAPPSIDALRERLEHRGEDAPEVIAQRLRNAAAEMEHAGAYRHVIVNQDLDIAYAELIAVLDRAASSTNVPGSRQNPRTRTKDEDDQEGEESP